MFCCCPQASDEFGSLLVMTAKHKLRSFAFSPAAHRGVPSTTAQLALGLTNNSVEVCVCVGGGCLRGGWGGVSGGGVPEVGKRGQQYSSSSNSLVIMVSTALDWTLSAG